MTLEDEWQKQRGPLLARPSGRPAPESGLDRTLRVVAFLILVAIFTATLWVLTLVFREYIFYVVAGIAFITIIHLYSRTRELGQDLRARTERIERLESERADPKAEPPSAEEQAGERVVP